MVRDRRVIEIRVLVALLGASLLAGAMAGCDGFGESTVGVSWRREWRADLWQDNGLVFTSGIGTSLLGGNLHRSFKAMLRHAGLPEIRFHDLRHTCATLLLRQGVNPKFVQELLGHADIALTLNVYSHVLPDMGSAAAGATDAALG